MITAEVGYALVAFFIGALLALRYFPIRLATAADRALRHRVTPFIIGAATALAFWWVGGATLRMEPLSTDEASYLLQAELFAHGQVTAPAPPILEFFEEPWVVITPRIYSKYPPGHALALAPGVALGLPWLIPLFLNGIAGALIFSLLRRAVGPGAALLTWGAWVLSGMAMSWQASYFSEVTLLACWLGMAATFWRWLDGAGTRWILAAALCFAYGMITRPLTILLLALPLAVPLWRAVRGGRGWRPVLQGAALAAVFLAVAIPAWNLSTTGKLLRSPLREYTETYVPWDRLGFAIDSTPPLRAPPPDLRAIAGHVLQVHRDHTVARLPLTLLDRADHVRKILFSGWRWWLLLAGLFGIWQLRGAARIVVASAVAQFLGHAVWAHEAGWTLYYAESAAAWFVPGAVGILLLLERLGRRYGAAEAAAPRAQLAVLLAFPVLLALSIADSGFYRGFRGLRMAELGSFTTLVREGPPNAIYFVRYAAERSGRPALIRNDPRLAEARAWVVYDLGARDQELLRLAPERTGYLVDEATRSVTEIPRE